MLFWRIDLKPGQRIKVQAAVTIPAGYNTGTSYERLGVALYDPIRHPARCPGDDPLTAIDTRHALARSGGTYRAHCSVGNVADRDRAVRLAGTYYVQVGIGRSTVNRGTMLPLQLTIEVGDGVAAEPDGPAATSIQPSQAAPPAAGVRSSTPTTAPPDQEPAASTITEPLVLTGAAVALAALAWLVARRRRQWRRPPAPPRRGSRSVDEATVRVRGTHARSTPDTASQPRADDATVRMRTSGAKPPPGTDPQEPWHRD
ncbi:hypothetical protein [Streptomyces sp. NPDC050704]|uniref:hypothetical protein n=1 Tax=Streptomyces sp. NPDC050704 TaxID=3157219 RepID=UPI003445FCAD